MATCADADGFDGEGSDNDYFVLLVVMTKAEIVHTSCSIMDFGFDNCDIIFATVYLVVLYFQSCFESRWKNI